MKQNFILLMYTMAISYVACNPFANKQPELWFYTHSVIGNAGNDSLLTPASFLYLENDGSYTRDFNTFDYGHWIKKGNQLVLTNAANITTSLLIKNRGSNEMQLISGKSIGNFEAQPSFFTSSQMNPYSLTNNNWRIQATQKETEQQIKQRLYNHCKFWEAYFTWALENDLPVIDVRSTPTPIKIYGNGFELKRFKDLPVKWRSYFYDSADCKKANDIIQEIFDHGNIAWARTDNKYKMFIAAFQQIEQHLR